jgi:hypothetical protein
VSDVNTLVVRGKPKRMGRRHGQDSQLEEGDRHPQRGHDRILRRSLNHGDQAFQANVAVASLLRYPGLRWPHEEGAGEGPPRVQELHSAAATTGPITSRFRGGGHKRATAHRLQAQQDRRARTVAALEYDPNRSARIALLHYATARRATSSRPTASRPATRSSPARTPTSSPATHAPPLHPLGTVIHNIELKIGKGGQLVRSAGTAAQLMAKDGEYARSACPRARSAWST